MLIELCSDNLFGLGIVEWLDDGVGIRGCSSTSILSWSPLRSVV